MSATTRKTAMKNSTAPVATDFDLDHIPSTGAQDGTGGSPMFASSAYYQRMQGQESSRVPLIAGGVASVAVLALIAGTMFLGQPSSEVAAPEQTASISPVPIFPPAATPDAQLIAPAPAPVVRQQASLAPRRASPLPATTPADAADASSSAADASATAPAVPTVEPVVPENFAATDAAAAASSSAPILADEDAVANGVE